MNNRQLILEAKRALEKLNHGRGSIVAAGYALIRVCEEQQHQIDELKRQLGLRQVSRHDG